MQLPVRNAWFEGRMVRFVDAGMTPMRNVHNYLFVFGFTREGQSISVQGQYNFEWGISSFGVSFLSVLDLIFKETIHWKFVKWVKSGGKI